MKELLLSYIQCTWQ